MKRATCAIIILTILSEFTSAVPNHRCKQAGEPLFLTPLIESGKIVEARRRALVQHVEMKNVKSYSGYFTINKTLNSNTFFWYFPARDDPRNAPLLLWLNGGPGTTSLLGLFSENGPFIVTKNLTVELREYSWHINHNIVYIDNPVGAGFSFTDSDLGYATNQVDVGRDVLRALVQFFKMFPELRQNEFFVTGESYGGKHVPAVSHAIKMHNKGAKDRINLKGVAVGNGMTDPVHQMNRSEMLYQIGLIDENERKTFSESEKGIRELIKQDRFVEAAEMFDSLLIGIEASPTLFTNSTGFRYFYNYLLPNIPSGVFRFVEWVERCDVRRAIHVGDSPLHAESKTVMEFLLGDLLRSCAHIVSELLDEDYRVLIYSGQIDLAFPFTSVHEYLLNLPWSGSEEFKAAKKKMWWVNDELAGYSKVARNLNEVLVRNAGHLVPMDQPLWAWDLITRFTRGRPF